MKSGSSFHLFDSYPELRRTLFIPDEGGRARLVFHATDHNPFVGPALELLVITHLARRDGVILHGCGISTGGRGVVFAGESGAGKSTLARLWAQQAGIEILSDDRIKEYGTGIKI
jgi:type II secretory pathway predicted ATPase ExeA